MTHLHSSSNFLDFPDSRCHLANKEIYKKKKEEEIKIMPKKSLSFFVTINKLTDELILQEGGLLSLKIPKQ